MDAAVSRAWLSAGAALALLGASLAPAQAQPVLENRASYGPVTACIGSYAIAVREGEAVSAFVDANGEAERLILLTDDVQRFVASLGPPAGFAAELPADESDVVLPHGIAALRIAYRDWAGYRPGLPGEAVHAVIPAHRAYVLPGAGKAQPLTLNGTALAGQGDDSELLGRVAPRAGASCATLDSPAAPGAVPSAAIWRPATLVGPVTVCSDGARIEVPAGFRLRRSWDTPALLLLMGDGQAFRFGAFWLSDRTPPGGSFRDLGFRLGEHGATYSSFLAPAGLPSDGNVPSYIGVSHQNATREQVEALVDRMSFAGKRTEECDTVWS